MQKLFTKFTRSVPWRTGLGRWAASRYWRVRWEGPSYEVVALLSRYGFENTFAEHPSITEQMKLFANTHYLVALTGAGLIQQFYMNPGCGSIIELMPRNRLMPEYYWQAYTLKMHYYDIVVGGEMQNGKDYSVDLAELEVAVQRMLANKHTSPMYGLTALSSPSH